MKRVFLFLATNLAIVLVLSVSLRMLGVEPYLNAQGRNLGALLITAAVMGFGGSLISLALSKWMAKKSVGAETVGELRTATEQWLVQTVARQAQAAGIKVPEVAVWDSPEANAFATGMNRNAALVAVSTGLLQRMSRDEAEAVLGHEIAHIANGDMVTLALIQGVVNTFVLFLSRVIGHTVDRVVFRTENGQGPAFWITVIIADLVLGILASIIVMAFSRRREFRADAGGAQLAGRGAMIAALERLASLHPPPLPDKMAAFGIAGGDGGDGGGPRRLFTTHPPLSERIDGPRRRRARPVNGAAARALPRPGTRTDIARSHRCRRLPVAQRAWRQTGCGVGRWPIPMRRDRYLLGRGDGSARWRRQTCWTWSLWPTFTGSSWTYGPR